MADEEDFSQLPLPDRFAHKNWKVRKEAYEAAAKEFDSAQSESAPIVRQFLQDSGLWKGAVADSNVAAQQEGLGALISFLQIAGPQGCTRTRHLTMGPIVEKGLAATRPAAKQKAMEAILLYIELDKPDPIVEELHSFLSHKQPKLIAATLNALTQIYHAYGCKTVEPKPTIKTLPKVFGHADKNVRAEAQNLTVEFYRWLKDAMKPLFWGDLKPVQQQDLEKLFEKVKDEPPPKQERLLRSQQAAVESAAPSVDAGGEGVVDEAEATEAEIDLEPEYMAVDVMPKIPKDFHDRLGSSKWKDRKEALDELYTAINHPKIEEGHFDDYIRGLAKSMKDANIMVVTVAANCVEAFARGLKKSFAKYRSTVMNSMMERLKEKKQAVTDAITAALDAVFASTSLGDCLDEILEFLKHKNPQVKLESSRFLIRCLKNTRDAPHPPEVKTISEAATKLLTESQEVQRSAGAEVLGTLWKVMGDRIMNPHLDGLDDIRKNKIKEFYESAEVKAKYKPKPAPAPKAAAAPTQKRTGTAGKRPAGTTKKPTAAAAPAAVPEPPAEEPAAALAPRPSSRPGGSKLTAPRSGLTAPSSGLRGLQKRTPGSSGIAGPSASSGSPRRPSAEEPSTPAATPAQPKLGGLGAGRGLAGRSLAKPAPASTSADTTSAPSSASSGLTALERAELAELRAETERLRRQTEELRAERTALTSQVHELQNQNAQLIEDHTRDVLSIKAKETQLVRARSDAEAAEQTVASQQREVDRLKRELSRQVRAGSPSITSPTAQIADRQLQQHQQLPNETAAGVFTDAATNGYMGGARPSRSYMGSPGGEGKENLGLDPLGQGRGNGSKLSGGYGTATSGGRRGDPTSMERPSPTRAATGLGGSRSSDDDGYVKRPALSQTLSTSAEIGGGGAPAREGESWKRAAEVTQSLKARIEQMKAKQGLGKPPPPYRS